MTPDTDERRARAMTTAHAHRSFGRDDPNIDYQAMEDRDWHLWLDDARAIRASDEAAGMVLVPREATEEMRQAGWIDKEDVSPEEIYRAMIAATEAQE